MGHMCVSGTGTALSFCSSQRFYQCIKLRAIACALLVLLLIIKDVGENLQWGQNLCEFV